MTKVIYGAIALLALTLSAPVSAQMVVVEEDPVLVSPTAPAYTYAPGTLQYYNASRRLDDDHEPSRTASEISPNETDDFYQQMDRENRGGNGG